MGVHHRPQLGVIWRGLGCAKGDFRYGGPARDARAQQGYGAGERARAAIAAGAEEIEQATELQRQLAREDVVEGQLGIGLREVDPPIPGGVACGQREMVGGVPAAEEHG